MKILINDIIQLSNAPTTLKRPALADIWTGSSLTINLASESTIDCVGIGNTDATRVIVNGQIVDIDSGEDANGLYLISEITVSTLTITHNGSYIGRFAAGKARSLGVAPAREPKRKTTVENRRTLSGQPIPGAGGYSYREIDVDIRYGIDQEVLDDIAAAYRTQIARGFPMFLFFDCESHRIPYRRMNASTNEEFVFQSGVNRMLYSKKFTFREEF